MTLYLLFWKSSKIQYMLFIRLQYITKNKSSECTVLQKGAVLIFFSQIPNLTPAFLRILHCKQDATTWQRPVNFIFIVSNISTRREKSTHQKWMIIVYIPIESSTAEHLPSAYFSSRIFKSHALNSSSAAFPAFTSSRHWLR